MRKSNLSRKRVAERMKTSQSQASRLLDPKDGNVTLATLPRAATIVGRKPRLELVKASRGSPSRRDDILNLQRDEMSDSTDGGHDSS